MRDGGARRVASKTAPANLAAADKVSESRKAAQSIFAPADEASELEQKKNERDDHEAKACGGMHNDDDLGFDNTTKEFTERLRILLRSESTEGQDARRKDLSGLMKPIVAQIRREWETDQPEAKLEERKPSSA